MSLLTVETENCNSCGICIMRCPNNFLDTDDEVISIATEESCAICGHCMSLCPRDAIVHHTMEMDNFDLLDRKKKYDPDEFEQFVRSRRSIRRYKDRQIPRDVLERLVDLTRYAATGGNKQDVEILVIEDKDLIAQLSDLTESCIAEIYPGWDEDGNGRSKKRHPDPIFYHAPALIVFHQPKPSGKTDSIIAAQTMVLAAMTLGLGSCYIGFVEHAWQSREEVREIVDLPKDHIMGSALILGYSKLTYLRTVDRYPMKVRWE